MNRAEFDQKITSHTRPVVVDFWAPWCAPCRVTKPILDEIAREYENKVDFWMVNADESPEVLQDLKIYGIPTVLLYQNGAQIGRYAGAQSRENYRAMFEALSNGERSVQLTIRPSDRILRLAIGTIISLIGINGGNWLMISLGVVIAFTGVYDRCPIWRALSGWWKGLFARA